MKNIILTLLCLGGTFQVFTQNSYTVSNPIRSENLSEKKAFKSKDAQIIPFNLIGGLIMVDTKIDGEQSICIFDTGAPSIIINKDNNSIVDYDAVGVGVNGSMNIKSMVVREFTFGKIKKKNIKGMEVDISHLEKLKKQEINGIIGVGAYDEEEVLIDYKKSEIQILPRKHKKYFENKTIVNRIPFYMEEQLPVIKVKIGKKTFFFGVDTGAEMNVINTRSLKKIKKSMIEVGEAKSVAGINSGKNIVESISLDELKINKQVFESQKFVILDLCTFNQTNRFKIDGILGFPFLKENLISFDFRRSKINFWKENYFTVDKKDVKFVENGVGVK